MVKFLQHIYSYIYNPLHSYVFKKKKSETHISLLTLRLFSNPNQVFDSVDGRKSLLVDLSAAIVLGFATI